MHIRLKELPNRWYELGALLVITLAALSVRGCGIGSTTLDHFDEGVYAFSALGVSDPTQPHRMYPQQEIFSPPLYFGVGGVVSRVLGLPTDKTLMLISVLMGTLTPLATWWFARTAFGARPALAAATLIALNPFHIVFSRSALTDVTFTMLLTVAIALLALSVERGSLRLALVAGLAVGATWNTKYHGWFALLICASALVPHTWNLRKQGRAWRWPWLCLGVASLVAFLTYLPWLAYLSTRPGGLSGMADHYVGMMRTQWLNNFIHYSDIIRFFETPLSRVAGAIATVVLLAPVVNSRNTRHAIVVLALIAAGLLTVGTMVTGIALCFALVLQLRKPPTSYRLWVLLAWGSIFMLSAPLYHPYARLILPLLVAIAVGAAAALSMAAQWIATHRGPATRAAYGWATPAVFVAIVAAVSWARPSVAQPWKPGRGMLSAADALTRQVPVGERVLAMIEPPAAYYMHRAGRPAFENTTKFALFDTLTQPVYVITGVYVNRSKRLKRNMAAVQGHFTLLGVAPVDPYDVRLLDDMRPEQARKYRMQRDSTFDLRLYRFEPVRPSRKAAATPR